MTSVETPTGSMVVEKERQIQAINSPTTALKVSGMNRTWERRAEQPATACCLTNGDPAPLMLWGEEW